MSSDFTKGLRFLIGMIGFVASAATIWLTPKEMRLRIIGLICLIVLILVIWIVWDLMKRKKRAGRQLPSVEYLEALATKYNLQQATADDIEWIAQLESEFYSSADAIPKHVLEEWYNANGSGFLVISIEGGHRIGHLDILPLRPRTLSLFIEGNLLEREIRGDSLYSPAEQKEIRNLYIESIILNPPKGCSRGKALLFLLCNYQSIIEKLCDVTKVESIYAMAASKAGERNMQRLGFNKVMTGDKRKDKHDLFVVRFSVLKKALEEICENQTTTNANKVETKRKKQKN